MKTYMEIFGTLSSKRRGQRDDGTIHHIAEAKLIRLKYEDLKNEKDKPGKYHR